MDTYIKSYGFKKSLPIEVEVKDLSEVRRVPHLFRGPVKAEFYQIIWLTKGKVVFSIDFREVPIKEGEIFIISANQLYGFDLTSFYEGKMILFTDSFFSHTEMDSHFLHTSEILNPTCLNKTVELDETFIRNIVSLLDEELKKKLDFIQPYIAQSFLRIILLEAERCIANSSSPMFYLNDRMVARRFSDEVEKHFKKSRQTEFYVQLLGVGEKLLSREVKSLTGKTPKVYIDSRIILEAKRLLAYSGLSVKEIAMEIGFDEATNFNKFFRKHTGFTPVEFRTDINKHNKE